MKTSFIIPDAISDALVWAFVHSLWQGVVIFLLLKMFMMYGPKKSTARYNAALFSLTLMLLVSVGTFVLNYNPSPRPDYLFSTHSNFSTAWTIVDKPQAETTFAPLAALEQYKNYILLFWISGAAFFLLRLAGAWWYVQRLVSNAIPADERFSSVVEKVCTTLRVRQLVSVAESASITAPVVAGFLKPVVLLPLGFASGLTTAQLEAILVHELMHIKRKDYIINIIQTIIESIFFFNPFVWSISSLIRIERENCCDDAVIEYGANKTTYVKALATLQEREISATYPALSLANNKNQLLIRIKRLMEKSVRHYTIRERIVPVVLLVIGLICASWFSIQKEPQRPDRSKSNEPLTTVVPADTVIKKKSKSATYVRKSKTTVDNNGVPKEEVVEEFEGDEELRPLFENFDMSFEFPDFPPMDFAYAFSGMEKMPPIPNFSFRFDSVMRPLGPSFDWESFENAFEGEFKDRFPEFYKKNQAQLQEMIEKLQSELGAQQFQFNNFFDSARINEIHSRAQERAARGHERAMELQKTHMKAMEENMKEWEKHNAAHLKEIEANLKEMQSQMNAFEDDLRSELEKDGYITPSEKINSMQWNTEGEIRINNKKIKDEHRKKYLDLHKKYFKGTTGVYHSSE